MIDINQNTQTATTDIKSCKSIPYKCYIRAIRISLGLTQSALAREIGTTPNFINMIEREHYYPILETRIKIARALKTDTSALWIPVETKKEPEQKTNSGLTSELKKEGLEDGN